MQDAIKGTMISYRPDIKVLDATIREDCSILEP